MRSRLSRLWRALVAGAVVAALVLACAGLAGPVTRAAPAAPACAGDTGDTSGAGNVFVLLVVVHFPGEGVVVRFSGRKPFIIIVPSKFGHKGFTLTIPPPISAKLSIVDGDTVRITLTKSGNFTINVSRPDCTLLKSWRPPISVSAPAGVGTWLLEALGKTGFVPVPRRLIFGPSVFRWVAVTPAQHAHTP